MVASRGEEQECRESMFEGKVCVVTGAGRGIGRAIALAFAHEGARVVVAERDKAPLESVASEIAGRGGTARPSLTDVSDSEQVKELFAATEAEFGRPDILVNNAAIAGPKLIIDCSDAEWDEVIAVNLRSVFLCSREAAKLMFAGDIRGRIINLSSINVRRAEPYYGAYIAAKGGVESFTMTLAAELGPYGITVNAIAPGSVYTAMNKSIHSPDRVAWKEQRIPLRAIAQPEDIVPAVLFFASKDAWYVTGQVLHVDGGSFVNANRQIDWAT